jgi:Tfp pilus assembly protein PilN
MGLTLDQAKRYLRPAPRRAAVWWLLLAASIAAAAGSGLALYRDHENLLRQERIVAALSRATSSRPAPKPSPADLESQRHWNTLRQELGFSWYPMFAALERTSHPNIALFELLPDKVAKRLTLRGAARDMKSLVDYLAALSAEPYFHDVYLSHQKKNVQNNVDVIAFEVRIQLRE